MYHQKSYHENKPTLYLVATPIGNLEDITLRALSILKTVDLIYAEDTRNSGHLLKHFDIKTPMHSYHTHNEKLRNEQILEELKSEKNIALISDAGTPLINDPGETLVQDIISAGYPVVSIPGPTAFLTALTSSGIKSHPFIFYGFLPQKSSARKKALESLKKSPYTLIFYEAPHRINETLLDLRTIFKSRKVTLARELTKRFEEYIHIDLETFNEFLELKGEMVLVVEGFTDDTVVTEGDVINHIELLIQDGLSEMEAIKKAAKSRNMKKNDVYMAYQTHKKHFQD
ncbi:16S rRNA (cytidine(1402)-2'-O)-methyltransferase [Liberiplasma polymorphum]|uniref:16S rRNA (cytidine(1402)-2'-O)-methyltransferase n=1 Tax=Liberiplasma polymorphum TaxID=3374570 RepID=UPI003770C289